VLTARPLSGGVTPASASDAVSIAIRRADKNVIVSISGQLTVATGAGIKHLLADLIRDQGNLHLVIDVNEVTETDGQGLELLLEAKRLALNCGAILTIRDAPESIRQAFEACSAERPS
jgi:anti-anti-sigma factor